MGVAFFLITDLSKELSFAVNNLWVILILSSTRFVPDNISFDDREPKSVATETNLPSDYAPSL